MPLASGNYIVEHVAGGRIVRSFLTGYRSDPLIGDFQKLARTNLGFYWKVEDGVLVKRQKPSKLVPDLIIVRSEGGQEILRWSAAEERHATGCV
jgi:hypothetical protein